MPRNETELVRFVRWGASIVLFFITVGGVVYGLGTALFYTRAEANEHIRKEDQRWFFVCSALGGTRKDCSE
jgi:predicted membrane channel-forming protein YqfA (hemolysin III family)